MEPAEVAFKYAAPTLFWAWDNRKRTRKAVDAVRRWFSKKSRILVVGPGGTGKSTLAKMLTGQFDWLYDNPWEYRASTTTEVVGLNDRRKLEMLVLPGQRSRRTREWAKVAGAVATGRYNGVVFVTSYGHMSLEGRDLKALTGESTKQTALDRFLNTQREEELEVFHDVAAAIRLCSKKIWLLTVVTKQDLWFDEQGEVQNHYLAGRYAEMVDSLTKIKGPEGFTQEIGFLSLLISNWHDPAHTVIKKTVAGYDHRKQVESFRHLVELFDGLRKWEKSK